MKTKAAIQLSDSVGKYTNLKLIYRGLMAGFSYSNTAFYVQELNLGTELEVRSVLNNSFDEYAVGLYFQNERIGWLPNKDDQMKGAKTIIRRILDHGFSVRCRIIGVNDKTTVDQRYLIGLWLEQGV